MRADDRVACMYIYIYLDSRSNCGWSSKINYPIERTGGYTRLVSGYINPCACDSMLTLERQVVAIYSEVSHPFCGCMCETTLLVGFLIIVKLSRILIYLKSTQDHGAQGGGATD